MIFVCVASVPSSDPEVEVRVFEESIAWLASTISPEQRGKLPRGGDKRAASAFVNSQQPILAKDTVLDVEAEISIVGSRLGLCSNESCCSETATLLLRSISTLSVFRSASRWKLVLAPVQKSNGSDHIAFGLDVDARLLTMVVSCYRRPPEKGCQGL